MEPARGGRGCGGRLHGTEGPGTELLAMAVQGEGVLLEVSLACSSRFEVFCEWSLISNIHTPSQGLAFGVNSSELKMPLRKEAVKKGSSANSSHRY